MGIEDWFLGLLTSGGMPVSKSWDGRDIVLVYDIQKMFRARFGIENRNRAIEIHLGHMVRKAIPEAKRIRVSRFAGRPELPRRPWAYELPFGFVDALREL